jgi:hypothetical protein
VLAARINAAEKRGRGFFGTSVTPYGIHSAPDIRSLRSIRSCERPCPDTMCGIPGQKGEGVWPHQTPVSYPCKGSLPPSRSARISNQEISYPIVSYRIVYYDGITGGKGLSGLSRKWTRRGNAAGLFRIGLQPEINIRRDAAKASLSAGQLSCEKDRTQGTRVTCSWDLPIARQRATECALAGNGAPGRSCVASARPAPSTGTP